MENLSNEIRHNARGDMMLKHRQSKNYDDYVRIQKAKGIAKREILLQNLEKDTKAFQAVFTAAKEFMNPGSVLCLGARSGAEVDAWNNLGFSGSVGMDLYPVGHNVIEADWHAMPFSDGSYPNVYTNALDHCLNLDGLASEIKKVLTDRGVLFFMATDREGFDDLDRRIAKGGNEFLFWQKSEDLAEAFIAYGFNLAKEWKVGKWSHYIMRLGENKEI